MRYRFDHVHLYADDVEATAAWYARVFGARVVRSRQSDGRPRVDLELEGLALYLGDATKLRQSLGQTLHDAAPSPHLGVDHFGLDVDDVEAAAVDLRAKGATITMGPKTLRPGAACLFVAAPDGVTIEVLHRDRRLDAIPADAREERVPTDTEETR